MRAVLVTALGATPEAHDREAPVPGEGQVTVVLEAASLNPVDVAVASGSFYAGHPPLPYVPAIEAVGRVADDGRRVLVLGGGLGVSRDGTAAERFVAQTDALIDLREDVDASTAAALGTAALAGWLPIVWRAKLQPGETVIVLGATGTAGMIAVQAARHVGAGRIVAAGRNRDRLAALEELVAEVVSLEDDVVAGQLQSAAGEADVVYDVLWGEPLAAALAATKPGARVVHVGQSAGPMSTIASGLVRGRQLTIMGYSNMAVPREDLVAAYLTMVDLATKGSLTLPVQELPFDEIATAWAGVASSAGKFVLIPS